MSCNTTTGMYLNVSTTICASGSASRSGNTVTISGTFSVSQGNSWNLNAIYATVNGYTGWIRVKPYSNSGGTWYADFSFSFTDPNAGSATYSAVFQVWNNAETGGVGAQASTSFSASWNAAYTAPTGLGLSGVSVGTNWVKGTVYISSWGGTGDANSRYRNLSVMDRAYKPNAVRRYQRVYGNSTSSEIYVDNNTQYGSLTIVPNSKYWLWWYATNGTLAADSGDTSSKTIVTLPPAGSFSLASTTDTQATVSYSLVSDGGFYAKNLQYSLNDGSTWVTGATINSGSATSGSFVISGLSQNTTYTIKTRVSTTAGSTAGGDISFTTLRSSKFYGSVNGKTKLVDKMYGPVNGKTKEIKKMYGPELVSETLTGLSYSTGGYDPQEIVDSIDTNKLTTILATDENFIGYMDENDMNYSDIVGINIYYETGYWSVYILLSDIDDFVLWFPLSDYDEETGGTPYTLEELGITLLSDLPQEEECWEGFYLNVITEKTYETRLIFQSQN